MSVIEVVAAGFGLLSVWLTVRQSILCWPTGLVMVLLYAWIFLEAKLYSDMGLQLVYIVLCSYGWVHWARGGVRASSLPVTVLRPLSRAGWTLAGLASAAALGYVMATRTDASLPYWDALTTTLSLVAQYLMARKKLESWAFWVVVDIVAIGVYLTKGLDITAGLYAVFLVLACMGYVQWTRAIARDAASSSASSCLRTEDTSSSSTSRGSSVPS